MLRLILNTLQNNQFGRKKQETDRREDTLLNKIKLSSPKYRKHFPLVITLIEVVASNLGQPLPLCLQGIRTLIQLCRHLLGCM